MVSTGLQILGAALGLLGWIGAILVCALPMWKVTAFIGTSIVTAQTTWEGIWMNCVHQSTGQMQCKVYDSMLALSSDLQAARALTILSIVVGILAILLSVAGGQCTNCVEDKAAKTKVGIAAGVMFIIAGILCLVPVCWTAHNIIRNFYNPLLNSAQKRELGAALYIGWGAAGLMLIGGGMLCSNCPPKDEGSYTASCSGIIIIIIIILVMVSQGLQIMGVTLAFIGWLGTIITCAMPMWRVTAFVGANIVTAQVIWEGLWMNCVVQSTGQMQCKVYDSMLALPQDLQAARAMVVISVIVGVFGVLMAVVGGKCTNCMEDEVAKAKACIVSGVIFIITAMMIMIPVSWSAHAVIRDFYNPLVIASQRRELGAALYIGWGSAGLLLLGGGLLCNNCPRKDAARPYAPAKFAPVRTASSNVDYV
ncbi:Claudin-4 [Liparis tanakae]|uniref:Claudin-4 n=1 Tax=Liparis tanakae TaxID=230148 RepID=A0A4Z2G426_9TELE|nr:Claudin-4 [Liparis tanakae]